MGLCNAPRKSLFAAVEMMHKTLLASFAVDVSEKGQTFNK
jgi:hypothetical protein